jgi:hypothetical protein
VKLLRNWLFVLLLVLLAGMVRAEERRTLVKGVPRIIGREIEQLVLVSTIHVGGRGKLVPGMATMPDYYVLPNRFVAASEDSEWVYYQAVAQFRPATIEEGGLMLSRTVPDAVYAFIGDARNFRVPLRMMLPLDPEDVRKLKLGHSSRHR